MSTRRASGLRGGLDGRCRTCACRHRMGNRSAAAAIRALVRRSASGTDEMRCVVCSCQGWSGWMSPPMSPRCVTTEPRARCMRCVGCGSWSVTVDGRTGSCRHLVRSRWRGERVSRACLKGRGSEVRASFGGGPSPSPCPYVSPSPGMSPGGSYGDLLRCVCRTRASLGCAGTSRAL